MFEEDKSLELIPELKARFDEEREFAWLLQLVAIKMIGETMVTHIRLYPQDMWAQLRCVAATIHQAGEAGDIPEQFKGKGLVLSPWAKQLLTVHWSEEEGPEPSRACSRLVPLVRYEGGPPSPKTLDEKGNNTLRALSRLVAIHLAGEEFSSWVEVEAALKTMTHVVASWE